MREEVREGVASRAELKLKGAVEAFGYDFQGKTVLDIGSSTGGFTELALRMGARKVIAVEKGTRQMKAPLRFDERIELWEKVDFFKVNKVGGLVQKQGVDEHELVTREQVQNEMVKIDLAQVDTVLADVSFVSLGKILMHAKKITPRGADYLVMLKPQFEAGKWQLNKGVVKNEKMRREIVRKFEEWLRRNGFLILKKRDNEVVGKVGGNRERFYWLRAV